MCEHVSVDGRMQIQVHVYVLAQTNYILNKEKRSHGQDEAVINWRVREGGYHGRSANLSPESSDLNLSMLVREPMSLLMPPKMNCQSRSECKCELERCALRVSVSVSVHVSVCMHPSECEYVS